MLFFKMNLPSKNHSVLYKPFARNHRQKTIQNLVFTNSARTSFKRNVQKSSGYHQSLLRSDYSQVVFQAAHIVQPSYHHPRGNPGTIVTISYVDNMMTVKETASWIRTVGDNRGWQEAVIYAKNFRKNNIRGSMLKHLNHEILKFDLGMLNHLHRRYLLATIRQLFPSRNHRNEISMPTRLAELRQRDITYNHCQKTLASAMTGSVDQLADKFRSLTYNQTRVNRVWNENIPPGREKHIANCSKAQKQYVKM